MKSKAPMCRNCKKKTHKDYYIELAENYLVCRECIRIANLALMKREMDEMK